MSTASEPGVSLSDIAAKNSTEQHSLGNRYRFVGEVIALIYIGTIAAIAYATGAFYILFPELGALSHHVFTRPRGAWASAPMLLAITPVLTGAIGIVFTRELPYGYPSVLLTVAGAIAVIFILKSPIAPAISAGLLPLTLGVKSWWYPPGILLGSGLLAVMSVQWKRLSVPQNEVESVRALVITNENVEHTDRWGWLAALMTFVTLGVFCVELTGHPAVQRMFGNSRELRFILFPPLVVIGFEMFGHSASCPWANKPLLLPITCFTAAAGGLLFWLLLGQGPVPAALSMAWGIGALRLFDLHVPPALAVALLPQVMASPTIAYPVSVGMGTLLLVMWFFLYRSLARRWAPPLASTVS